MALPFPDRRFDAVTVGFGLRNMPDYLAALSEMARVLRPGGTFVCLETTPSRQTATCKTAFDWYLLARRAASLADSRRRPRSVRLFTGLGGGISRCGNARPDDASAPDLSEVRYLRLGCGTVALHVAAKPSAS